MVTISTLLTSSHDAESSSSARTSHRLKQSRLKLSYFSWARPGTGAIDRKAKSAKSIAAFIWIIVKERHGEIMRRTRVKLGVPAIHSLQHCALVGSWKLMISFAPRLSVLIQLFRVACEYCISQLEGRPLFFNRSVGVSSGGFQRFGRLEAHPVLSAGEEGVSSHRLLTNSG